MARCLLSLHQPSHLHLPHARRSISVGMVVLLFEGLNGGREGWATGGLDVTVLYYAALQMDCSVLFACETIGVARAHPQE